MFHTRFFNTVFAAVLVGAAALAAALALRPAAPTPLGAASAEALAVYHASERSRAAAPGQSAAGLALYHESEWGPNPEAAARAARMARAIEYLDRRNHIPAVRSGLFPLNAYQRSERLGSDW